MAAASDKHQAGNKYQLSEGSEISGEISNDNESVINGEIKRQAIEQRHRRRQISVIYQHQASISKRGRRQYQASIRRRNRKRRWAAYQATISNNQQNQSANQLWRKEEGAPSEESERNGKKNNRNEEIVSKAMKSEKQSAISEEKESNDVINKNEKHQ